APRMDDEARTVAPASALEHPALTRVHGARLRAQRASLTTAREPVDLEMSATLQTESSLPMTRCRSLAGRAGREHWGRESCDSDRLPVAPRRGCLARDRREGLLPCFVNRMSS